MRRIQWRESLKTEIYAEKPCHSRVSGESKTIEKFLGKDFKVLSSYGHIRDLKKKEFSIDVDKDFKPHYEIPADKKKIVTQLKEEAEQAETVWLASDEDREGEAIAMALVRSAETEAGTHQTHRLP